MLFNGKDSVGGFETTLTGVKMSAELADVSLTFILSISKKTTTQISLKLI